jgi:hypothetical protein
VLKGYGFDSIEADIRRRETEVSESLTLRKILTEEEIASIREAMGRYEPPRPRGWAHAISLHGNQCDIHLFELDKPYNSNSLDNLSSTLHEVGIQEDEIFAKIWAAREFAVRYRR